MRTSEAGSGGTSSADAAAAAAAERAAILRAERAAEAARAAAAAAKKAAAEAAKKAAALAAAKRTAFQLPNAKKLAALDQLNPPAGTQPTAAQLKGFKTAVNAVVAGGASQQDATRVVGDLTVSGNRQTVIKALAQSAFGQHISATDLAALDKNTADIVQAGTSQDGVDFLTRYLRPPDAPSSASPASTSVAPDGGAATMDAATAVTQLTALAGPDAGQTAANNVALQQMSTLLDYSQAHNFGTVGRCLGAVQDYLEAARTPDGQKLPGAQIQRFDEAHQLGDWLNQGNNAASVGLKRLDITNPYDAPKGAIIVVAAGSPGTRHPTAGDASVATGDGRFINDNTGEQYGGNAAAWNAAGSRAVLVGAYVPIGYTGKGAGPVASQLTAESLPQVMPKVRPENQADALKVSNLALQAAGVTDPKQSAAFVAMLAAKTDQFSSATSYGDAVALAQSWKAQNLNDTGEQGDLNALAAKLGVPQTSAQKDPAAADAALASALDRKLAEGGFPDAGQTFPDPNQGGAQRTAGQMMVDAGKKYGVDPKVLLAIAKHETGFGTLGVGVKKMLGVTAYDSDPDGNYGDNGVVNQLYSGAETFARLRAKGGASESDPLNVQTAAVNAAGWATDQNWHHGVDSYLAQYQDIKETPPAPGQDVYENALTAFGANTPASTAPSGSSSSGGGGGGGGYSSSGGGGTSGVDSSAAAPVQSADATPAPADPVDPTTPTLDPANPDDPNSFEALVNAFAEKYKISGEALKAALEAMGGGKGLSSSRELQKDPKFLKFIHSQPGMESWKPGDKLADSYPKAFLAEEIAKAAKQGGGTDDAVASAVDSVALEYGKSDIAAIAKTRNLSGAALNTAMQGLATPPVLDSKALAAEPGYAAFVKAQPGMEAWATGQDVPVDVKERFLATRVAEAAAKAGGTDADVAAAAKQLSLRFAVSVNRGNAVAV